MFELKELTDIENQTINKYKKFNTEIEKSKKKKKQNYKIPLSNLLNSKFKINTSKNSINSYTDIKKKQNSMKRRSSILLLASSNMANKKKKVIENITPGQLDKLLKDSRKKSDIGKLLNLMKFIDIIMAILVSANIIFSLLENELFYKETKQFLNDYFSNKENKELTIEIYKKCEERKITKKENFLRYINLLIVISLLIFNYIHYKLKLKLQIKQFLISEKDTLISTGKWKFFILETLILIIFNPPNLNFFFTGTMENYIFAFSLGGLICIETMFKSYIIIRLYTYFSKYMTDTAKYLCNDSKTNSGIHFSLKCELKNRPYTILFIILISTVIILGFSLRNFEYFSIPKNFIYGTYKGEGNDQDYLKDLINSIWMTIITMTTVGYGDFFPSENYGRLICILSYLIGCVLVSLTVVSLAIISEFSEREKNCYSIIKKLNADKNVFLKAAQVISSICLLRLKFMEKKCSLSERFVYIMKLKQDINVFKNDFKIASHMNLPIEQTFKIIFTQINENYDKICNNIIMLENINLIADNINKSQKECIKKIRKIQKRQKKIGDYLVEYNNQICKQSYSIFTFSPSRVKIRESK